MLLSSLVPTPATTARRHPLALIVAGVCLYATGPVLLQASQLSGPAFSFWRLWMGAALFALLIGARRLRGRALPERSRWRSSLAAGVVFGLHQLAFMIAVKATSVVDVALMNALAPIATGIGAWWLFRERPGRTFWGWALLAMAGTGWLALGASVGPSGDPAAMALAIANVVLFAAFFLASKRSRDHLDVVEFLAGVMLVAAVVVSAFVLIAGTPVAVAPARDLALVAGVALGPGAVGHFITTWPLRWVAANIPPVVKLAQPFLAGVLAWLVLGEPLLARHLVGGTVVLAGAAGAVLSRDGRRLQREARLSDEDLPRVLTPAS